MGESFFRGYGSEEAKPSVFVLVPIPKWGWGGSDEVRIRVLGCSGGGAASTVGDR
jgi:hypothetical protein